MDVAETPTLVLVHGAWSGAWVWEPIKSALDQRGVDHRTVDLPGSGGDRRNGWRVSMNDYAQAINSVADGIDGPTVLVGHCASTATYLPESSATNS